MVIIPHSAALSLSRMPWISLGIILLCLLVFIAQETNGDNVTSSARIYCSSIYQDNTGISQADIFDGNPRICSKLLVSIHTKPSADRFFTLLEKKYSKPNEKGDKENVSAIVSGLRIHYDNFRIDAPASLNSRLVYDPATWNPIRVITSSVAHGGWGHILGNLVFFFAFAPALEILIGSAIRYIGVIFLISIVSHYSYSIFTLMSGVPTPSLGLSGVVMGIIGLSVLLMPNARIRTLVWLLVFVRNYYIPVWLLAAWYIGWDTWYMLSLTDYGGINLVSHVSGAFAGLLIGYFFFKQRRMETKDELDEEVQYQRNLRSKSNRSIQEKAINEHVLRQDKKEFEKYISKIHHAISIEKDSEAINLLLERYNKYSTNIHVYDDIYQEMKDWKRGRAFFCAARLVISLCIEHGKIARALIIAEECLDTNYNFRLASPLEATVLTKHALNQRMRSLAIKLADKARTKYGVQIENNLKDMLNS